MPTTDDEPVDLKALKVKIPTEMYTQLHSLKVLRGQDISSTISDALEAYLERLDTDELDATLDEELDPDDAQR